MTKYQKKIGKWLFMLAAAVMVFSMGTSVKAEDETVWTDTAKTDTVQTDTTQREKLPTPQNVSISDDWVLSFDSVPEANGYYRYEILRDDDVCCADVTTYPSPYNEKDGVFQHSIAGYISESGSYSVTVQASNKYDPDKYEKSDSSEPAVKNYVKPDRQLGSTTAVWDEQNPGQIIVAPVENAGGYEFWLYEVLPDGTLRGRFVLEYGTRSATEEFLVDFSYRIEEFGAGQYVVKVRVLSADIDEIANGEWGEASAVYDTEKQAAATDKIISDAVNGEAAASDALDIIVNQVAKDKLGIDMQTNDKVLEQIKALEERYAKEKGIAVTKTVSEEASKYVGMESVSITGAGLNAQTGSVTLDISVPDEKVEVPGDVYAKSIQLDIKLKNENTEIHELKVPVTITVPIPDGLEAKHLILLHYHGTGEPERVVFKDNNDGTVTFTVKDFSVFVFAEDTASLEEGGKKPEEPKDEPKDEPQVSDEPKDEPETPNEPKDGSEDTEEPEEDEAENTADKAGSGFRAPDTSDTANAGLYFGLSASLLILLFFGAAGLLERRNKKYAAVKQNVKHEK